MYSLWYIIILILWTQLAKIHTQKACPLQDAILPCRCLVRGQEYQIWCSHSDLPKVLEGLKAVSEYIKDPIDELIIENNFLPSLPGRTFYPLKILRLMLRHNGLERVSSDWLAGLQSTLVEIFIVERQLRSLPDDSLLHLNSLQAVTIQTALLKRIPIFSGLPKLRYLQIESESLLELSPLHFKKNPKLEKVHITSSSKLTRLEADVFFDLPNLSLLNISYCGISWIHPRAINGLPLLKEIWLVGNKITDAGMVGRASRNLPQLEIIKLDYNFINKLDEGAFVDLPALKKIYLSNNRITELNQGAFHMVPQLKTLDLNRNMLRRVHPETFLQPSGSGLEELYLVENDISHIGELRSLLDALPRLVFLDMSFNNLEAVPFDTLRGHPTLEYINLDYNKLRLIDREAFMAMPALRELRLRNNSLSDILETPLWNLPALKGLDLSENFFKTLYPNFFENLQSLRRIDLSNNELTVIDPELFLLTPSLEHINISYNYITKIHPATFSHLLNLYELDISHNHLIEFVMGLPRGIEYLHLRHNEIGELPLGPSPDLDLPMLRKLDLSANKIQTIPKGSLRTMPQLKRLYIGRNLLQSIAENSLIGLRQLEIIDFFGNQIGHIHPHAFKETTELKIINLSNNRLDILTTDLFKDTPHLQRIDISKNQLAEILPGTLDKNLELENIDVSFNILVQLPVTFYGLKNLRFLNLTSNRIKNVDPEIIGSLINLKELRLSKNFIQELKRGSFNNLPYLKILDLDNNNLEFIEPNSIGELPELKSVKMNENNIKEIPNSVFYKLPSLQVIELQDNELRVIAPNAFNLIPQLVMLNLSNNNLLDLEMAGLKGLKSLEVLDVSNNRINRIAKVSLQKMEWLVELRMDNNDICGIQGSSFNTMSRLRVLSLRNNKLTSFPEQAVQRLRSNIAILDVEGNPLICGCNILWLQAWLHESSQAGPHCANGTPLRQMQISRDECSQKDRITQMVAPGCEAEFLTAPGVYTTSQVFSQWMKLKSIKNVTKEDVTNKNNIAPSPEESEYFYDEYVDYPYNESVVDSVGLLNNKDKDKHDVKSVTVKIPATTKSPHYTSGDTPTIYAAPKNSTKKPTIPQKVNNSPSTSGFTFFGVPLPNLNLNNLLGRGSGRKEVKLPSASVTAERKTAIVNKPEMNTGRSSTGGRPSNLPLKMQPPPPLQPPTLPEMQTGFLPVLPGYGGFKPIPDPSLSMKYSSVPQVNMSKYSKNVLSANISLIKDKNGGSELEKQKLYVYSTEPIENTSNTFSNSEEKNKLENFTYIQTEIDRNSKIVSIPSTETHETTTDDFLETGSIMVQEATITTSTPQETTFLPKPTSRNIERIVNKPLESTTATESISIITTEEPEIITTSNPRYVATVEVFKNSTSDVFKSVHVDKRYEEYAIEKTPHPVPIGPGGNEPLFKHNARSTITKVLSPHVTNPRIQSNIQKSNTPTPSHHKESKNTFDYFTNPASNQINNDNTNWYFANYNSTNLEPYVARITNSNNVSTKFKMFEYNIIFLVTFYIQIIL